jgi:ParB family chromosome partitioning protein
VNQVIPDPEQPRVEFSEEALERLAQSIRDKGQLTPIRVRWSDPLAKWIIIFGERRWRATMRAGLPTIDAIFHDGAPSRQEVLQQQLIENLLREDLQPIEEAKAFSELIGMNDWSQKELADSLRVPESKVTRALALLKLPEDVQEQVATGAVSPRAAYQISRIPDEDVRRALAGQVAAKAITHEDAARIVRKAKGKAKPKDRGVKQTFLAENGFKVMVTANHKGTYHEIEQALSEALDDVRTRIRNRIQLG